MAGNTEKIEELLQRRRRIEDELERLNVERDLLGRKIEGVLDTKNIVDREIAAALELDVVSLRLSVRQAVKEILKTAGSEGITVEEICARVWRKTNKGSRDTILGYLEREDFAEGVPQSGKWRARGT